jgi:hypothetical protein
LVHWEAIAQPVAASWSKYGDGPAGGCWGGQVVYYNNKYWDFFFCGGVMNFVTTDSIKGPWSLPTAMNTPSIVPGLGYDNSIFIDDDGKWYLVVKNGQVNNWIVELGSDGQPNGAIFNLTWLNPSPSFPYSWAEGPVMWKYKGYYYYSFARDVAGGQKVMRSSTLTDEQSSWTLLGDFFNESDPLKSQAAFQNPNHSSAPVIIDDSTSWVVHPLWNSGYNKEWFGQGRQGLLNQVKYDSNDKPTADYPVNTYFTAPRLPSSSIPWMVPHSDFFNSDKLNPEWSFLGYTPSTSWSVSNRSGWLTLYPKGKANTIIKNDGEHNYSIITKLDYAAENVIDQAGILIFNGNQTRFAKLYCSVDSSSGDKIVAFSYDKIYFKVKNPDNINNVVLLKLVRINHKLTGFFSLDGVEWTPVGSEIDVANLDNEQENWNSWTGNRQGLFVQGTQGKGADFDYYIYRDAYTPILAECPANQYGTKPSAKTSTISSLDQIHNEDWALYAGVEFGNSEYQKAPDSLTITASCNTTGGLVEVWLDSLDSNNKIAECTISNTGGWRNYQKFTTKVLSTVTGKHDVYLRFIGAGTDRLFMFQWFNFISNANPSGVNKSEEELPGNFKLGQNFPNPFNPVTQINYSVPYYDFVTIKVYNLIGQEVKTLFEGYRQRGNYTLTFDGSMLSSGMYLYKMTAGDFTDTKKILLLK